MKNILDFNNDKIKQQQMYCNKISERYDNYTNEELQFVFSAFFTPAVWEDAPKVYEEIVSRISFLEDELPIMFIGGSSQNKITRKNQPIGFFITDYTIYVLEASLFSDNLPKSFPYSMSIDKTNQIVNIAVNSFTDWEFLESILSSQGKESLIQLVIEAVTDILTLKKDLNITHVEKKKSTSLVGRIIDFGIMNDTCIKIGDYDKYQKHFRKIHKKFNIPSNENIQLAITDSTLAGIYGLVITEENVYSRDLMEKPYSTKKVNIAHDYPVSIVETSIRLGDTIIHTLPSSLDNIEAVKDIIVEFINNELTI